jgi:predicted enzyme related to lactoylglutathione lyase
MSESNQNGRITWHDLTVNDAAPIRDFYAAVAGWKVSPVSMGDYDDFVMMPETGDEPAGGVCHARGENSGIPAVWLIYIQVPSVEASLKKATVLGGKVVHGPRRMGESYMAIVQDPAGAYFALFGG